VRSTIVRSTIEQRNVSKALHERQSPLPTPGV
jgi:hypothetical protein